MEKSTPQKFISTANGQSVTDTIVTEENLIMANPQGEPDIKIEYNPINQDGASLIEPE